MWRTVWTQPRTRRRILLTSAIIWLPPMLLRPLGTGRDAWLIYLGLVVAALALTTWTTVLGERRDRPPPSTPPSRPPHPPGTGPPRPGTPRRKGRRPR